MRLSEAEAVDSFYSEVRWEVEDTAQLKSSEDGVSCIGAITHGQPPFVFRTLPLPLRFPLSRLSRKYEQIAIQSRFLRPPSPLQTHALRPQASSACTCGIFCATHFSPCISGVVQSARSGVMSKKGISFSKVPWDSRMPGPY